VTWDMEGHGEYEKRIELYGKRGSNDGPSYLIRNRDFGEGVKRVGRAGNA